MARRNTFKQLRLRCFTEQLRSNAKRWLMLSPETAPLKPNFASIKEMLVWRKSDNTLNNQVQVTKKVSVDLVITNAKNWLRKMKFRFPEKLIIAHLNFNYIRNNFDSLSSMIENKETHYSIQRLSWMFDFHQVNSIYVNLVYLIDMTEIHCTKNIFYFSKCSEKMVFPKQPHWNMIFLVLSGKMIFHFPENMILFFIRKSKDDPSSKKIHGNKIFSSNVLKRWYFQEKKNLTGIWYFL